MRVLRYTRVYLTYDSATFLQLLSLRLQYTYYIYSVNTSSLGHQGLFYLVLLIAIFLLPYSFWKYFAGTVNDNWSLALFSPDQHIPVSRPTNLQLRNKRRPKPQGSY